ncbi:hypothetical protein QUB10_24930 [Microcoleus sp. B5-D4]|uniref:hypothetical protein n=1 Tax=unclassified Microcoleus TaxID=2642155 RepID=UPI002FD0249A
MHPRYCNVLNNPFRNRQDACSTRNTLFVEQASCLLLTMVEQARCLFHKKYNLCGTGILPVADNGGTGILHLPALYFKMLSLTE